MKTPRWPQEHQNLPNRLQIQRIQPSLETKKKYISHTNTSYVWLMEIGSFHLHVWVVPNPFGADDCAPNVPKPPLRPPPRPPPSGAPNPPVDAAGAPNVLVGAVAPKPPNDAFWAAGWVWLKLNAGAAEVAVAPKLNDDADDAGVAPNPTIPRTRGILWDI